MVFVYEGKEESGKGLHVTLTEEQEKRVKEECDFWHVGFVHPDQVLNFKCHDCGDLPGEKLNVYAVIPYDDRAKEDVAQAMYKCGECSRPLFAAYIPQNLLTEIPDELILRDETGKYIRPTNESIETLFSEVEREAAKGHWMKFHSDNLNIAQRWAGVIEYELDQSRIDALKTTCRESYIQRMIPKVPELVNEILEKELDFNLDESSGFSGWDFVGERAMELFALLPHIPVPEDMELCAKIKRVLDLQTKMYVDQHRCLLSRSEQIMAQAETLEAEINDARGTGSLWLNRVLGLGAYLENQ
jgi:hypothetical protein